MRQISKHAIELLQQLQQKPRWLSLFQKDDERIDVIEKLRACGEVSIVTYLAPLMLKSGKTFDPTCRAIWSLLRSASDDEFRQLDEELRCYDLSWGHDAWRRLKPGWLRSLTVVPETAGAVFGLLSFHSNGHVREAAVRRLAELHSGSEVPYLLIRLNDWVKQVRDVSRVAVHTRLQANEFDGFFQHLDLVFRLKHWGRDDHSAVVEAIGRYLASNAATRVADAALGSSSRFVRRQTYATIVAAADPAQARPFIKAALRSDDGVIRLWATRDSRQHLNDEELRELLPALVVDDFMPVRREALNCVLIRFPDRAKTSLVDALLDPGFGVRDLARFHLRKMNEIAFAAHYRRALSDRGKLKTAIAGLGETGTADDAHLLEPYLSSARPNIRAATVQSVGKLGDKQFTQRLLIAVKDESKKVTAEAIEALRSRTEQLSLSELGAWLQTESGTHVLLGTVELIEMHEAWQSLPWLIEAAASENAEVARAGRSKMLSKFNRVFTKPTNEQRARIFDTLERNASRLSGSFASELVNWLALRV